MYKKVLLIVIIPFVFFPLLFIFGCGEATSGGGTTPATLTGITVSPTSASINVGQTQQFTCTGSYSDGTTKSVVPTWSVSNTKGSISAVGLFSAAEVGTANVFAVSSSKNASASVIINEAGATPPSTPTGLAASVTGNNSANLSWSAATGATGYIISYGTDTSASNVGTLDATSTSKALSSLKHSTKYYVKILAYNANSEMSAYSSIINFTTNSNWSTPQNAASVGTSLLGMAYYSSLAIDNNGKAHVVFIHKDSKAIIKYATNSSAAWVISVVREEADDVIGSISIVTDSNNKVHCVFTDVIDNELNYTNNTGGSFSGFEIDDTRNYGLSLINSLQIDSSDKLYYAFSAYTSAMNMYFASKSESDPSFSEEDIDVSSVNNGYYVDLILDVNNNAHIVYHDADNKDLEYANNIGGSWNKETIESAGEVGYGCSIAKDSNGKLHIAYLEDSSDDLKYVSGESGAWHSFIIDNTDINTGFIRIEVDSTDAAHIIYQDGANKNVKYATNKSGAWSVSTIVDTTNDAGHFIDFKIDSNDHLHVIYLDKDDVKIKYITLQ